MNRFVRRVWNCVVEDRDERGSYLGYAYVETSGYGSDWRRLVRPGAPTWSGGHAWQAMRCLSSAVFSNMVVSR